MLSCRWYSYETKINKQQNGLPTCAIFASAIRIPKRVSALSSNPQGQHNVSSYLTVQ
jgi:hypothetical protein